MKPYIISYDLNNPGQDYNDLINKIKSFPYYSHFQKSNFLIKSTLTAKEIYNQLSIYLDDSDLIFISELTSYNHYGSLYDWDNIEHNILN